MVVKVMSVFFSILISVLSFFGINLNQKGYKLDVNKLSENIISSTEKRLADGDITGAHILVDQNGEEVFNMTFGSAHAGEDGLSADAVYRIASMTKPITAAALLIEYDRGNIDIYADVADYLPEFKDMYVGEVKDGVIQPVKKAENPLKVYMLVSHTSGIAAGIEGNAAYSEYMDRMGSALTLDGVVELLSTQPLMFEPGTSSSYSTGAFDIAAKIIENTSGMPFDEYIKVNIFDKLGMTDTTFAPTVEQFSRMVGIHDKVDGKAADAPANPETVFGNLPVTYLCTGGGLASTASDYMKFAEMLLNKGKAPDGTVVMSEKAVEIMSSPVPCMENQGGSEKWGMGVRVITGYDNTLPKGSFGWSGAYGTHFWVDPLNGIAAVYMKNSVYDGGAGNNTAKEFEKDVTDALCLDGFFC